MKDLTPIVPGWEVEKTSKHLRKPTREEPWCTFLNLINCHSIIREVDKACRMDNAAHH